MSGAAARVAQVRGMSSGEPSAIQASGRLAPRWLVRGPVVPFVSGPKNTFRLAVNPPVEKREQISHPFTKH
jgi:hypothetical protein